MPKLRLWVAAAMLAFLVAALFAVLVFSGPPKPAASPIQVTWNFAGYTNELLFPVNVGPHEIKIDGRTQLLDLKLVPGDDRTNLVVHQGSICSRRAGRGAVFNLRNEGTLPVMFSRVRAERSVGRTAGTVAGGITVVAPGQTVIVSVAIPDDAGKWNCAIDVTQITSSPVPDLDGSLTFRGWLRSLPRMLLPLSLRPFSTPAPAFETFFGPDMLDP